MYSGRILMLLITHQDTDKTIFISNELAHLKFLCFHFRRKKERQKDERTKEGPHRKTGSSASTFMGWCQLPSRQRGFACCITNRMKGRRKAAEKLNTDFPALPGNTDRTKVI